MDPRLKSLASGGSGVSGCILGVRIDEMADRADDERLLLGRQLGIDRQCEGFAGGRLGDGKIARLVAQGSETRLKVERYRVVDFGADLAGGQKISERVAEGGGNADDELVVDVIITFSLARQADQVGEAEVVEELLVASGGLAAIVRPRFEVAQLDAEDGGLEGVEPRVETDFTDDGIWAPFSWTRTVARRRRSRAPGFVR